MSAKSVCFQGTENVHMMTYVISTLLGRSLSHLTVKHVKIKMH